MITEKDMSEKDNELTEATEKDQTSLAAEADGAPAPEVLSPDEEYIKRTLAFGEYYRRLLCVAGAIEAAAIALAVLWNVLVGVSIAVLGAVIYFVYASDEAYKKLGVRYVSGVGGITITKCRAVYGDTLIIPPSLIGLDTLSIGDRALCVSDKNKDLRIIYLPATLKTVGEDIFEGCDALEEICFEGSREEWKKIDSRTDFTSYEITFCAEYPKLPKKEKKSRKKKKDSAST